jgi:hypothetical protein
MGAGTPLAHISSRRSVLQCLVGAALGLPTMGCDRRHDLAPGPTSDVWPLDSPAVLDAVEHMHHMPVHWLADHREAAHAALGLGGGPAPARAASIDRRTRVLVLGAGVAGLAAARALMQAGVQDQVVIDLQVQAGGHAQGLMLDGPGGLRLPAPWAAHYLPVPAAGAERDAPGLVELLAELGLLQRDVAGRWQPNARHLCHSPQERLYAHGQWHSGLLLLDEPEARSHARHLSQRIEALQADGGWRILAPSWRGFLDEKKPLSPDWWALDAMTFEAWLQREGITHPSLLSYLDYCCRDDYGAGLGVVSAWAGVHYFAARHGFATPLDTAASGDQAAEVWPTFTWPQGNGWITERLAAPLGPERLLLGRMAVHVQEERHGVTVQVQRLSDGRIERWQAAAVVIALPAHVLRRVWPDAPANLRAWAVPQAHWQLAHLVLDAPPRDRPGPALAWDNVVRGGHGLGVVHAGHQNTDPRPGPMVLTWYHAGGIDPAARLRLQMQGARAGLAPLWADLLAAHPDLPQRVQAIVRVRHGHAMPCPVPGVQRRLQATFGGAVGPVPPLGSGRIRWVHSDCAGYAIFEEAFCRGHLGGQHVARRLSTM